jgi:hypothetical protein
MTGVLVQIDAYDPVAAAAVTLRAASRDDDRLCMLDGQSWLPGIVTLPLLSYDSFSGAFDGRVTSPDATIALATDPWPNLPRWSFPDARIRIWVGALGDAWGSYVMRFDGRVRTQPAVSEGLASIGFGVDDGWLDQPLLGTYAGTGGAEGPATLKGVEKPLAIGAPRFVPGVLVDAVNLVYQISAFAIEGVDAALDRLTRYPAAASDHANHAALLAATIAPGFFATCIAEGKVRFGAPPFGKVSFLVKGDKAGTDGWVRTPGKIIRRIALLSGGAGKIDDASLNALDAARPYNQSLHIGSQTTARVVLQNFAAGVNAVIGVSHLGQLFASPVEIGSPVLTLNADGSSLPAVASIDQVPHGAPFWRLGLAAERTWDVHGDGDFVALDPPASVTGSKSVQIAFDSSGVIKPSQLPLDANFKMMGEGGSDLTTLAAWTRTLKSGSATSTIGAATGTLNVTAFTTDAVIEVKAVYAGVERTGTLTLLKTTDAPPVGGGGSGGSGSSASASVSEFGIGSSYGSNAGGVLLVQAGSGGQVACSALIEFFKVTDGTEAARGKWRWRIVGGSFADIASEISSSFSATRSSPPEPLNQRGTLSVSMTKTGLVNGTDYEFEFLPRSAGDAIDLIGTISATGS